MRTRGLPPSRLPSELFSSVHSGIDWLSCSAARGEGGEGLWAAASAILDTEASAGNKVKPWRLKNLSGHIAGAAVRAVSQHHVFAQVSGQLACTAARQLIPFSTNVSRLDLQLTAEGKPGSLPDVARWAYKARAPRRKGGRPIEHRITLSDHGGATCYLGSPQSDVIGRVYDKGVESKWAVPGTIWRWEVQLRRDVAELTSRELALVESLELDIESRVRERFLNWGVPTPDGLTTPHNCLPRKVWNDSDRLLEWLRISVSPTVRYLCGSVGVRRTYEALSLTPPTDSIP